MVKAVGFLMRVYAQRIVRQMLAVVPSARTNVHTACENNLTVDHREFLMVTRSHRHAGIEAKLNAIVRTPVEDPVLHELTLECVNDAEVPGENVDMQLLVFFTKGIEERQEPHVSFCFLEIIAHQEAHVAVELPARDANVGARGQCGSIEC